MKNQENKNKFIGGQIKIAREEAGLSQLDLAKAIGFESSTAISLIESGDRNVTVENLERIANILHKDIKFFLGNEDKPMDVKIALRADKGLSKQDKDAISHLIDLARKKRHGN